MHCTSHFVKTCLLRVPILFRWQLPKRDHKLIDDLQYRADRLFDENSSFKDSSFTSSSHTAHTTTTNHSSTFNGSRKNSDAKSSDDPKEEREVFDEKDQFVVKIDVSKFPPQKVQVKVLANNTLLIDAAHEEKTDEHNYVTRTLTRKFILPRDVDVQSVVSRLTENGLLTICAPKKGPGKSAERIIPVKLI